MNIALWVSQILVAFFCIAGAAWRFNNYEEALKTVASMQALSKGTWNALGAIEALCALGLVLPGLFKFQPQLTVFAAAALALEMLFVSSVHLKAFGLVFAATNPAVWTVFLAALAAFIAYGRQVLSPL